MLPLARIPPTASIGRARGRRQAASAFSALTMAPATIVYIDGFNLYYGRLKRTPYKWLDLGTLCKRLLPRHDIIEIKYFTARVRPRPTNNQVHLRQQAYLSVIQTIPNLLIFEGHFLEKVVSMPLANSPETNPKTVRVLRSEEKGSDVALASHLVADGYEGRFETAVIISNDSDLVPPISIVRDRLHLTVGVLNPHETTSHALRRAASFYRPIRAGVVASSQFPEEVLTADGRVLRRPDRWR